MWQPAIIVEKSMVGV